MIKILFLKRVIFQKWISTKLNHVTTVAWWFLLSFSSSLLSLLDFLIYRLFKFFFSTTIFTHHWDEWSWCDTPTLDPRGKCWQNTLFQTKQWSKHFVVSSMSKLFHSRIRIRNESNAYTQKKYINFHFQCEN